MTAEIPKNGSFTDFYMSDWGMTGTPTPTSQMKSKGEYKDGKKDGNWTEWWVNGQKKSEGKWLYGKQEGKRTEWHENGQIESEGNYINGKPDGKWTEWNENGQIEIEVNFKDGKQDGKITVGNDNGQIKSEENYINDKPKKYLDKYNLDLSEAAAAAKAEVEKVIKEKEVANIILTTENSPHGLFVKERIEIITAECVFGMNIFRDIFASVRNIVGGRSSASQKVLRDARKTCLLELKIEAHSLGADAVIGVDLDYSEFSGGGKSMLFLVASGTAVKLKKE